MGMIDGRCPKCGLEKYWEDSYVYAEKCPQCGEYIGVQNGELNIVNPSERILIPN